MRCKDPQVNAWLDVFLKGMENAPSPRDIPIKEWRSMNSEFWKTIDPPVRNLHRMKDIYIPGPEGEIRCKLYVPRKIDQPLPALAYFHGGGVCLLSPDDYHGQNSVLSQEADCIVLAPAYRLAPEHKCPAAIEDCYAVLRYLQQNGSEIGADQDRIAIAGDSGGGYLTCAVTHKAKREGTPQPLLQIPIYPVVDVACETRSRLEHSTFLQTDIVKYTMGELYADGNLSDPIVSPLREKDFSGLAPAYIITAEFDPLKDEGETYAHKLRAAGVRTFYHCYENMYHGFFSFGALFDVARLANQHVAGALRDVFRQ